MSARALDALAQLDPLTQLVVGQVYGFTGSGPKSPNVVSAEMGITVDEVSKMLEEGLRALAGYKRICSRQETQIIGDPQTEEELFNEVPAEKKSLLSKKPYLKLVKNSCSDTSQEKIDLKIAKG